MVGLPDGEKNKNKDMYNRLDTIPACDRRTDWRTDILPRHSPRYAYASRGNKMKPQNLSICDLTVYYLHVGIDSIPDKVLDCGVHLSRH